MYDTLEAEETDGINKNEKFIEFSLCNFIMNVEKRQFVVIIWLIS